jgi:hypothetical protein
LPQRGDDLTAYQLACDLFVLDLNEGVHGRSSLAAPPMILPGALAAVVRWPVSMSAPPLADGLMR